MLEKLSLEKYVTKFEEEEVNYEKCCALSDMKSFALSLLVVILSEPLLLCLILIARFFSILKIDMEAFLAMNDSDLQLLGINETLHRRRILEAIRELNVGKERDRDRTRSFIEYGKRPFAQGKLPIFTVIGYRSEWFFLP